MKSEISRGSVEMTAAMLISGTIGWFVLMSGQSVSDVVFWRCIFGAATLLVICAVMGFLRPNVITRRQFIYAVLGGVALVLNWVLLFASYSQASIAIGTAVYNTQPFIFVALGAVFLGERVTITKVLWLLFAFAGLLVVVSSKSEVAYASSGNYVLGVFWGLGAAFFYAIASLITKKLKGVPPHLIALIQVSVGILMLAPMADLSELPTGITAWASLISLGVLHTGVMYILLYGAIQKLPTGVTASLSFIYPISAVLIDYFVFGHALHLAQVLGISAILLGAAGMNLGWRFGFRVKS